MYTEYEIINIFLINIFKSHRSKIYLIEDGGFATYIPFSIDIMEKLNIKEVFKSLLIKQLPGMRGTNFCKFNNIVFNWASDNQIDGLCVYKNLIISRNFPVFIVDPNRKIEIISVLKGRIIFLNQDMYNLYLNTDDYFESLKIILKSLTAGFNEVFFKFHPSENVKWKKK